MIDCFSSSKIDLDLFYLLTKHVDLNYQNKNGCSVLMKSIIELNYKKNGIVIDFLVENSNLNLQNKDGNTALMLMIKKNIIFYSDTKLVNLFLKHGVNLNTQNNNGDTILHLILEPNSTITTKNQLEIIKLFINNGINPYILNNNNVSACQLAILSCEMEIINLLDCYVTKYNLRIINDHSFYFNYSETYGRQFNNIDKKIIKFLRKKDRYITKRQLIMKKILKNICIESNKILLKPNSIRTVLLELKFSSIDIFEKLSKNIQKKLLEYFSISNNEIFNSKNTDIFKYFEY